MPVWFGYSAPFLTDSTILPLQYDERLVKNDILLLLLTGKKERRMNSSIGTELTFFPFEPNDDQSINRLTASIRSAIIQNDPRVNFRNLIVTKDVSGTAITLTLYISLKSNPSKILPIDLTIPILTDGANNVKQ